MNEDKKQNMCGFLLNYYLVSYIKSTVHVLTSIQHKQDKSRMIHAHVVLGIGTKVLLTTALKLEVLAVRRHTPCAP